MAAAVASADERSSVTVDVSRDALAVSLVPEPPLEALSVELVVTITACVLVAGEIEPEALVLEELGPLIWAHTSQATFSGGVSDCRW